jgi:hypothetical protein
VGARIMLRRNIATEDGLVNGVQGEVTGFQWADGARQHNSQPVAILIAFNDERVGAQTRLVQGVSTCSLTKMHTDYLCVFVWHGRV